MPARVIDDPVRYQSSNPLINVNYWLIITSRGIDERWNNDELLLGVKEKIEHGLQLFSRSF